MEKSGIIIKVGVSFAFAKADIAKTLNTDYYAVKMDASSTQEIRFFGKSYQNTDAATLRYPIHDIAKILAGRDGLEFATPAIVILDKNFDIVHRSWEYLPPNMLNQLLETNKGAEQ